MVGALGVRDNVLSGYAVEHAHARCTPAGEWSLHVDIELPLADMPPRRKTLHARIVKFYGSSPSAGAVCRQTARWCSRGVRITALFRTAFLRGGRLVLVDVGDLSTDVPPYMRPAR